MNKQAILIQSGLQVFHTNDLATLWQIDNSNSLYTAIKRYVKTGKLYRLQKGLYSLIPPSKLDRRLLARNLIPFYCYLSLDTVLYENDFRSQKPRTFTFVGLRPAYLTCLDVEVSCRQISEKYLFNSIETFMNSGVRIATPLRAVCDTLYLNPKYYFDKKINWSAVNNLQAKIGYPITRNKN